MRAFVDLVWICGAPAQTRKTVLSARLAIDCGRTIPKLNTLNVSEEREVPRVAESLGVTRAHRPA